MKIKKNILRNTCILLVSSILISTSIVSIADTINNSISVELFKQEPYQSGNPKAECYTSNKGHHKYFVYDDFWDVTSPIGGVHWWGQSGTYDGLWHICDPEGMIFNIAFYEDDNGYPGQIICEYTNVNPSITPTGIMYEYEGHVGEFEMRYFEAQLYPQCTLSEGWISIVSTGSNNGCSFKWGNSPDGNRNSFQTRGEFYQLNEDLAFILTSGLPIPDLKCNGDITWTEVKPSETVISSFTVENNGEMGSLLDWEILDYPIWGHDWSFSPSNGSDLKPSDGKVTVEVSVGAHSTQENTWEGEIKIVNKNYVQDFEIIQVSLTTSKTKTIDTLFIRLLDNYPLIYHLIQQFFKL
jgi:hypothetical protein